MSSKTGYKIVEAFSAEELEKEVSKLLFADESDWKLVGQPMTYDDDGNVMWYQALHVDTR